MTNQPRPREAGALGMTEPDDPVEARRIWLTGFWAMVLRRFRDQLHASAGRGLQRTRATEEDR